MSRQKHLPATRIRACAPHWPGAGDTVPEILYYLAEDPDPAVRRLIADNAATPVKAKLLLVEDEDEEVRVRLARQIARLVPGLTAGEQDQGRRITWQILEQLARDQVVRVRQILAETLQSVAEAPPDVIRRLAHDAEVVVATPILEFSPVLTDDDLLEIIESSTLSGALSAISRRSHVPERVSDAIATTDDEDAITALLSNPSAQIREETLDRLVERAPSVPRWHGPLVGRPHLHRGAAIRLAHFVADNLLRALTFRQDLDPATAVEVAKVVRRRIEEDGTNPDVLHPPEDVAPETPGHPAFTWRQELLGACERAKKLLPRGGLEEALLAQSLGMGDELFVAAALAVRGNVLPEVVMAVLDSQSGKGMTALAWRANLSPAFAARLQMKLAHIAPAAVLQPNASAWPLGETEMEWQLELFGEAAHKGTL